MNEVERNIVECLGRMHVSLLLVFNRIGRIIWHSGRAISGFSIFDPAAGGFCRTLATFAVFKQRDISSDYVLIPLARVGNDSTSKNLRIKHLQIICIKNDFYIYLDSKVAAKWSELEIGMIVALVNLLLERMNYVQIVPGKYDRDIGSEKMERIKQYILGRSPAEIPWLGVEAIARRFKLTRRQLEIRFRKAVGIAVSEFIDQVRMLHAVEMLKANPHASIGAIGKSVGYDKPVSFTQRFRETIGLLPHTFKLYWKK